MILFNKMKNVQLREELKKTIEDNQRLKEKLSQTTNELNFVQMQLVAVISQREDHHHLVINTLIHINKHLIYNNYRPNSSQV